MPAPYEQGLTNFSVQQLLNMSVPLRPVGHVHPINADLENEVIFPTETYFIRLFTTIPIWISLFPGVVTSPGPDRFRFEGGGCFPFITGTKTDRIYITNFTAAQTDDVYFILGN